MVKPYHEMDDYERGRHGGHQDVYNALISMYLDERERLSATGKVHSRDRNQRHAGRAEVIVWAAMITWGLDEEAATVRAGEDIEERRAARAD